MQATHLYWSINRKAKHSQNCIYNLSHWYALTAVKTALLMNRKAFSFGVGFDITDKTLADHRFN